MKINQYLLIFWKINLLQYEQRRHASNPSTREVGAGGFCASEDRLVCNRALGQPGRRRQTDRQTHKQDG